MQPSTVGMPSMAVESLFHPFALLLGLVEGSVLSKTLGNSLGHLLGIDKVQALPPAVALLCTIQKLECLPRPSLLSTNAYWNEWIRFGAASLAHYWFCATFSELFLPNQAYCTSCSPIMHLSTVEIPSKAITVVHQCILE